METNNTNNTNEANNTENAEKKELTDAERREMLKKMAREAIKNVEDGKADIVDEKQPDLMTRPHRRVVLSDQADIVHDDGNGNVTTVQSYRAVYRLLDVLNTMPDSGKYSIYIKEDPKKSDLPGPGEKPIRNLFQPKEGMEKRELMKFLASQYLDPRHAVLELQKTCTLLAEHSELKNIMITMVFDGSRPSGFVFNTDASAQTIQDIEALGNASRRMTEGYISDMKRQYPGQVSFEGDGDIILPSSVDATKLVKSAKEAQDIVKG